MCTRPAGPNCVELLTGLCPGASVGGGEKREEGKGGGLEDRRAEQAVPGGWEEAHLVCAASLGKSWVLDTENISLELSDTTNIHK